MTQSGIVRSVYLSRVGILQRDVSVCEQQLRQPGPHLEGPATNSVSSHLARLQRRLVRMREPGNFEPNSQSAWSNLHALSLEVSYVSESVLAILTGSAQRAEKRDLFDLADSLVDDIVERSSNGGWQSFSVPTASEEYSTSYHMVGIRYPLSFWRLPLVAHEAGHVVGARLVDDSRRRTRHPLEDLAGSSSLSAWSRIQETFADALAGFSLGPAYAWTCLTYGFDPLLADLPEDEEHPSFNRRMQASLAGMSLLDHPDILAVTQDICRAWEFLVMAAGGTQPKWDGESEGLGSILGTIQSLLPRAGYESWGEAQRLAASLGSKLEETEVEPETTVPDVLNAAWIARVNSPDYASTLTNHATRVAACIARRR